MEWVAGKREPKPKLHFDAGPLENTTVKDNLRLLCAWEEQHKKHHTNNL